METICEEYPKRINEIGTPENQNPFVIQNELQWGAYYRQFKKKEKDNKLIPPMKAPIDIPFELCRARQHKRSSKNTQVQKNKLPDGQKMKKLSLLEKSIMSQSKYMEYLSIPNPKYEEPPMKKRKRRCEIEPCPPRFVQLAVPNKRRVFANWKDYHKVLPTEMLLRFEQILHTDKNLEPRDARYYYKKLDKQKKKRALAKKRRLEKKRKEKEKGDKVWLESHIDDSVKAILDFIKSEPLFSLNYKQLMLSDGILTKLDENNIMKKPRRNSRNYYKKTIIEVCDKLSLWMDTLTKFVDVQAVESKEDIPPLTISSLEEESEGESGETTSEGTREGTSEEASEESEEGIGEGAIEGDIEGDETERTTDVDSSAEDGEGRITPTKLWDYHDDGEGEVLEFGPSEGKAALNQFFETLGDLGDNINILDQLIELYENSPEDFLMSEVEAMPGITHMDILNKLRELKGELIDKGPKRSSLEEAMIQWAREVDPDKVDEKMLNAIHEYACALSQKLKPLLGSDDKTGKGPESTFDVPFEELAFPEEGENEVKVETEMAEGAEEEGDERKEVEGDGEEGVGGDEEEGVERLEKAEDEGGEDLEKSDGYGREDHGEYAEGEEEEGEEGAETETTPERDPDELGKTETDLHLNEDMRESIDTKESDFEADEEKFIRDIEGEGYIPDEMPTVFTEEEIEGEEEPTEIDVLYRADAEPPSTEEPSRLTEEITPVTKEGVPPIPEEVSAVGKEDDRVIRGHKPSVVVEHSPGTVCCLSLKIWAVWLLEITHNAHTWTKWMHEVIKQVREFASIVRGDVTLPNGEKKILYKEDWRKFTRDTEEKIIAWRQYSAHVKELSNSIIDNFHMKKVNCCPKCLQDHLIKNVVTAHETFQALTEAMNCAGYWQRCLDNLVQKTTALTELNKDESDSEESGDDFVEIEELDIKKDDSSESFYEIEELDPSAYTSKQNR
ncbi:uncharacterized protein [Leptinotarsa decemlineata]|uniref:uncharacterized protein n=1 Tax=Leptinotarsa decemlineata TaxID=7539 RepID=UPI003D30AA09